VSRILARRRASDAARRTCLIVRHADALGRSSWRKDDLERPLSSKGKRQAAEIAVKLAGSGVKQILSSPAERCLATVAPLAKTVGVETERTDFLVEGSDGAAALRRLVSQASKLPAEATLVACSHGDVITAALHELVRSGVIEKGPPTVQKGGALDLTLEKGSVIRAELVAPFA